jgi:RNA polymerase sigma-70 factor (ECF subfamily)
MFGMSAGVTGGSDGSGDTASDGEIVRAILGGDIERYAVLVERYRNRYARFATRMLGSRDAAEDALQDALVRAFDRLAECREPDKFAGWLFLILRNRCFAEWRRQRRESRLPEDAAAAVEASERSDGPVERRERAGALGRAVGRLTPEQREAFVLKHVEGLSYEEMARLTGATVASLKMRMHRAYDRLRELLKEHL